MKCIKPISFEETSGSARVRIIRRAEGEQLRISRSKNNNWVILEFQLKNPKLVVIDSVVLARMSLVVTAR